MSWKTVLAAASIAGLVLGLGLLAGCSDEEDTDDLIPGPGQLLLSRVSVAMTPGASQQLTILPLEGRLAEGAYSVRSSDEAVAIAAVVDSVVTVTGVAFGACTITVDGALGAQRTIPVQVYDHRVIDTGELLVTFTDVFDFIGYWSVGCATYRPLPAEGFHEMGSLIVPESVNPNGQRAVMVVKPKPGSDAIAFTRDFEHVLNYSNHDFWRPVAPTGYHAMGLVATHGWPTVVPDSIACIRSDLTIEGDADVPLFSFWVGDSRYTWWAVDQPDAGPHAAAYLAPGTFLFSVGTTGPVFDPAMHVLKLDLPLLGEAEPQTFLPKLTGFTSPPPETPPLFARAMLVPCTTTRDSLYTGNQPWRVANSPFYRLERFVYYKLLYHNYNQTSQVQTNSVEIKSGITQTASETYSQKTGISIAAEIGLTIKIFSAKVTTTVSREFGYESATSVSELQERTVSTSVNTAPGKAAALWQEFNRYVLYRHNGTELEAVAAWEFGIDSYVTDEYPD